jgi:ABC-type lipoprotein release transport system permease subunit
LVRSTLLALVLAASLGFALFSATAARRTATAFDRFVVWSDAADAVTGGAAGDVPVTEYFDDLASLPSVVDTQRNMAVGLHGAEVHGKLLQPSRFFASAVGAVDARFDRVLVLDGSIPDAPAANQGIVDFATARQLDIEVGDVVTLFASAEEDVPPTEVPIEVVAIVSSPASIPTVAGYQFNGIAMGPAFLEAHPDLIDPFESSLAMHLRDGLGSLDDLRREMDAAGLEIDVQDRGFVEVGAQRLFTLEATTMWVAALLSLLVGLPVAYQLIRRDAAARGGTIKTVLALGASRRQFEVAAAARSTALALLAALAAGLGAVLASPLSPVGLARNAEVERGIYVDAVVLAVGIPLFILAVALLGVIAVHRGGLTSPGAPERAVRSRQPRVPIAVGIRMATGSRGPVALAGIGALVFVSLLVVGIAVAASSLESVPDDPEVSGGSWDGFMVVDPLARPAVEEALDEDRDISAHGVGGWTAFEVKGEEVYTLSLPDGMEPAIAAGRVPRTDREIALGAATMRRLGVQLGDQVSVSFPGYGLDPRTLTVTGESISAAPLFYSHAPDDSAVVTFEMPMAEDSDGAESELVRFRDRASDPQATLERVVAALPEGSVYFSFARSRRGDIVALEELEGLINAILVMAAGLALASLLHQVLMTHRRNASQMAVLRAVGFTRGNITETGAAHGGTLATITALLAIPVGMAAGATAWRYLAGELVVLPRTRYDLATIIGIGLLVVALATALAASLARRSARRPVVLALRAE